MFIIALFAKDLNRSSHNALKRMDMQNVTYSYSATLFSN